MKADNIIIEKGEPGTDNVKVDFNGMSFKNPIPITLGFDNRKVIGKAEVFIEDGVMKANMKIDDDVDINVFPAIGFSSISCRQNGDILEVEQMNLYTIGISHQPNCDKSIKSISEQLNNQKK